GSTRRRPSRASRHGWARSRTGRTGARARGPRRASRSRRETAVGRASGWRGGWPACAAARLSFGARRARTGAVRTARPPQGPTERAARPALPWCAARSQRPRWWRSTGRALPCVLGLALEPEGLEHVERPRDAGRTVQPEQPPAAVRQALAGDRPGSRHLGPRPHLPTDGERALPGAQRARASAEQPPDASRELMDLRALERDLGGDPQRIPDAPARVPGDGRRRAAAGDRVPEHHHLMAEPRRRVGAQVPWAYL